MISTIKIKQLDCDQTNCKFLDIGLSFYQRHRLGLQVCKQSMQQIVIILYEAQEL